jgi:hypothetical protein
MSNNIVDDNNEIIETWTADFISKVNEAKVTLGIKHDRTKNPIRSKTRLKKDRNGSVSRINITMSKGEIMTHRGAGRYPDNRTQKEFYVPIANNELPVLADQLAFATLENCAKALL